MVFSLTVFTSSHGDVNKTMRFLNPLHSHLYPSHNLVMCDREGEKDDVEDEKGPTYLLTNKTEKLTGNQSTVSIIKVVKKSKYVEK